ncbi:MAG TPA: carboxypeptidase regulatory-like domain-containing protein [Pirellulales bacterium]|nr:carboxypeptidase regulatory-like domain-containing protein [Pirellulales bacterium]
MLIHPQTNCLNARTALLVATLVALPLLFSLAAEQEPKRKVGAAALQGRVRDEGGEPLAGVRVRVAIPAADMRFAIHGSDHKQFEAISDDNGAYRLEIPGITEPTTISIDAMKSGYRRLSGTLMRGGDAPRPEVAPGVVSETNLSLHPALYFKGIVVDENGTPIPSVEIGANAYTSGASGGVERTMSKQDGEFELFNYPDKPFTIANEVAKGGIQFFHPDFVSRSIDDVYSLAENERSAMQVELQRGCKIAGTVRDAKGDPAPQVMVKASRAMGSRLKATITDSNGRFALRGIAEGPTVLSVRALDLKQKTQMSLAVDGDKNDLDVRLQEISLPPNLKSVAVVGMKLTDLTPELRTAYDLWDDRGALILDPGPESERLDIGTLAHGYYFWMVGNEHIASVREFVEQILAEAEAQTSEPYSIRVVYSLSSLEFDGTNTQYLKLSKDDIAQLKAAMPRLIGSPAPDLSGDVWLNADEPPTWKSLRGKPVLLVLFDLRQRSFLALVPPLLGFRETYDKQGLEVIGVYAKAPRDEIAKHLAEVGITFPVLIDDGKTVERYVFGYSTSVLIDREGKVVSVYRNSLAAPADIEKLIEAKNDVGD